MGTPEIDKGMHLLARQGFSLVEKPCLKRSQVIWLLHILWKVGADISPLMFRRFPPGNVYRKYSSS